ncbi:MAG: pantoate--beta-alanine ligase [Candidatus Omnitrophica bacterium]|nr:pantoate--beta-alanine ligase [Candidatus Omnitrophota bacterium]
MQVIRQVHHMARLAQAFKRAGKTLGLVPTMGALHDGHMSLIRAAHRQTQVTVVSLFVNPLQFGPKEDYARYPRDLRRDLNLAKAGGCDLIFAPDASQMYPGGFCTFVEVEGLSDRLEGASRAGHFRGVTTVVMKLLHVVQPSVAYFGQKDYQQALLIRRMVKDLNVPVAIRLMPTVREPDGLAMSSRNAYLTSEERRHATVLYRALCAAKARIRAGERNPRRVVEAMRELLRRARAVRVEYLAVADAATLEPLKTLRREVVVLVAARVGSTRLIDNLLVGVS